MTDVGDIRESNTVDRYDGSNFLLWKMHMRFIFQSRDMYSIVNGTLKKSSLTTPAEQLQWEKKDKQAIVAIFGTLDSSISERSSIVPPHMRCGHSSRLIIISTLMSLASLFKLGITISG